MNRAHHLILVAAAVVGLLALGAFMDGVSDEQVERAIAADLKAARRDELRLSLMTKACFKAKGPAAELVQIAGSDDYVCREREIEPTPEHVLQRVAMLDRK